MLIKITALSAAVVCSVVLTVITIMPPVVAGDWARLDAFGKYIPKSIIYDWPSYKAQIFLWIGLMLALWWAFRSPKAAHIPIIPNRVASYTYPLLIVVILLGFGLRLYTLGRLPLLIDEIGFAARAADILHGQRVPIFAPGHNSNPSVFSWLLAGVMSVFEQNIFAARLLSLAVGTLSIPAAYALGRSWWSRRVGLVAAAFLATYPAHVHFSRLALYNIIDPLFALLALALLVRALHRWRVADFAWVGVWAGIAQYFYHGSRMLPVLIAVYVAFQIFNAKTQSYKDAKIIKSLCVMLFAFVIVSLPRFAPMFSANLPITGNLDGVRLPADLGANALRSVLAWVGQPDVSPFWLGSAPLVPFLALLTGAVGFVIALRRLRDPRYAVLLVAVLLTTMFGGVIWPAAPLYVRYMTALPALVLLVVLPYEIIFNRQVAIPQGGFAQNAKIYNHRDTEETEKHGDIVVGAKHAAPSTTHANSWQSRVKIVLIILIMTQGVILSIQHTNEAYERVPAGLWEADELARAAAQLPDGMEALLKVSDAFGEVERVTIADYIAFYGQRRTVSIVK